MKEKVLTISTIIILVMMLITLTGCGNAQNIISEKQSELSNAKSELDTLAKEQFNAKFELYEGEKNGSMVKKLLEDIVLQNNASNLDDKNKIVKVVLKQGEEIVSEETIEGIKSLVTKVKVGTKYNITMEYNEQELVSAINIEQQ